ncbi:P27 family phage terminase small subunit [Paenibacillus senegalensis]|uniref:P27 family phage terminase small subunit n=1 Tax=Paenibacillus senegalensis TaxID=1465766 RepID=UPI000289313B|nr:P27 family phage terminase small subunit [Paenibacillus senegalensis]
MHESEREKLRKQIERDLKKQLKASGTIAKYHADLVQDYLELWDLKNELFDDIRDNGTKVSGMHGPKSNPSITDLHKTNDRMLKILEALNLNVPKAEIKRPVYHDKSELV